MPQKNEGKRAAIERRIKRDKGLKSDDDRFVPADESAEITGHN